MSNRAIGIIVIAACVLFVVCVPLRAADLPTWKLAELKGEVSGFGQPAKDGEHAYRAVPAKGGGNLTVPAWWGPGFRPAEGTIYVLKITYKDAADTPAVLYSHAGVDSYWGMSEVHRFGGAGDNQWKTADVPLSWDLICRKNVPQQGPGPTTILSIGCEKELPVESIVVTPAGPDAAAKYYAETRAWVARAQADKLKGADLGAKQEPVIPEALKASPVLPFARTYLLPLLQNSAPQKDEAGVPLKIKMATNEYEPAAFGVYANGKDLKNVTISIGPLKGAAGELACQIDLKTAEYAVVGTGAKPADNKPMFRTFPQRLWPMYPVDISAGQSHWFWLTIRTTADKSKPGKYSGTVTVKADGADCTMGLEVEVLPVKLLTMQECGLELGACGFCTLQEQRDLAEYNHTGMDIWFGGTQPQMKIAGGKLNIDWTYLDDWMAHATKVGWTHMFWFMGGDPFGFPDTLNLERDLYQAGLGDRRTYITKAMANPDKVIDELRPYYVDFIRQTAKHAKEKNWPKLIIHPFDEPAKWDRKSAFDNKFAKILGSGPWIKPHFQDSCALIREGAKGYTNVLVGGDIHHAVPGLPFVKDIDVFCTNAIHEDQELGNKVRAAGTQFWQYAGTGDQSPAHQSRFNYGFFFAAYDSRGTLIWAYDSCGRFDTSTGGGWGYGWYTPFGVIGGPFLEGIREGCDDRRWIETYKKAVGNAAAAAVLEPIGKEAIALRAAGGRDTVSDFYAQVQRYEKMDQWREKIMEELVKAKK